MNVEGAVVDKHGLSYVKRHSAEKHPRLHGGSSGGGSSEQKNPVWALRGNEDGIVLWSDGPVADAGCKSGADTPGEYLRSVGGCAWVSLQRPKTSNGADKSPDRGNWRRNVPTT